MRKLKLGVAGLGRAFGLMLPTLALDPRVAIVAAADPRPEARKRFETDFKVPSFSTVEELCENQNVEAVYVATPHQLHAEHARIAAAHGKHLLVEKPMAISVAECRAMIDAAGAAGVQLVVGPSHSFDRPILEARRIIASGSVGRVRMITALNFTDFLFRPRRPEELDTAQGGGVAYSQAAHQVDVVRHLAGSRVTSVRAMTGAWDPSRPTEGAYSCLLGFEEGCFASLSYSGYGHFDSDEFMGSVSELGRAKQLGFSRKNFSDNETEQKNARNYGGRDYKTPAKAEFHEHFGLLIVSCERADLRPQPDGVMVYGDSERRLERIAPPDIPRKEVIDELYGAVVEGKAPLHGGEWSLATLEVCAAILQSAREKREIALTSRTG